MKQLDIFDFTQEVKKLRLPKDKLITLEHEILNTIKHRPITTEELMNTYNLSRLQVRTHIKRIRQLKPGHTKIMNTRAEYMGKMFNAYSTQGDDLLFKRWKSSTITALENNPFVLEQMYSLLNELKAKVERPAEHQTKAQLNGSYKPHDVHYTDYKEK